MQYIIFQQNGFVRNLTNRHHYHQINTSIVQFCQITHSSFKKLRTRVVHVIKPVNQLVDINTLVIQFYPIQPRRNLQHSSRLLSRDRDEIKILNLYKERSNNNTKRSNNNTKFQNLRSEPHPPEKRMDIFKFLYFILHN